MKLQVSELFGIISELDEYKRDKNRLLEMYINDRLNQSLLVYYSELSASFDYLKHKNELKVLKSVNDEQ